MKNNKLTILGIVLVFVVAGIFFIANNDEKEKEVVQQSNVEEIVLEKGKEVPNFTLTDLDGNDVNLNDYRGKIVLLNFWATWCKYCDEEMPDLEKIYSENDDVVILAVNVKESQRKVSKYIEEGEYTFPVLLDGNGDLAKVYYVSSFPSTYFVSKDGLLVGAVPGMLTYDQMEQILEYIRNEF